MASGGCSSRVSHEEPDASTRRPTLAPYKRRNQALDTERPDSMNAGFIVQFRDQSQHEILANSPGQYLLGAIKVRHLVSNTHARHLPEIPKPITSTLETLRRRLEPDQHPYHSRMPRSWSAARTPLRLLHVVVAVNDHLAFGSTVAADAG